MIRSSILLCTVFLVSLVATALVRRYALKVQLLDYPNERSSHVRATPRGGGVGLVFSSTAAAIFLWAIGSLRPGLAAALVGGGIMVALVGFADDRGAVSVRLRMAVHLGASVFAMYCIGGLGTLQVGDRVIDLGIFGHILGFLGLAWAINLFNFMDGIDGLAGSEGTFVLMAGATCMSWVHGDATASLAAMCIASATLGFLFWNWPPAKIFMGDVGSGYMGYVVGVFTIAASRETKVAIFVWLILAGVFVVDATLTLARRLGRRERLYEAHRIHAYQWLARRWGSHRPVTVVVIIANVFWLFPCALIATLRPQAAGWMTLVALLPTAVFAWWAGAGRPEPKTT